MDEHICRYEERWGRVLTQLESVSTKICSHIREGEEKDGLDTQKLSLQNEYQQKKAQLSSWEGKLIQWEEELNGKQTNLNLYKASLDRREDELNALSSDLHKFQGELNQKDVDIANAHLS